MARVTALDPDPSGGGVRVQVDGAAFATVAPEDLRRLGLAIGEALDQGRLSWLGKRAEAFAAKSVALRLLAARALPSREILRRLVRKGHHRAAAEEAVSVLGAGGLIDDAEFARHYATTRARRHRYGPARLAGDLRRMGLAARDADLAVREAFAADGIEPRALLREAAAKKLPTLRDLDAATQRRRLKSYLLRRGFAPFDVIDLVKELLAG